MLAMYRLPGLLADIALVIYVLLNLAVFKIVPVTMTLPGIAGFILSVGMATDANILIYERMKEELRNGRSMRLAVEAGFSRAWLAIRDGNLSTLISCAVLYWFGNTFGASVVKGFALTLTIGVLLSMFTAISITRTFMRAILASAGRRLLESRVLLGY
jgi:preprotein translocase subunit SecD